MVGICIILILVSLSRFTIDTCTVDVDNVAFFHRILRSVKYLQNNFYLPWTCRLSVISSDPQLLLATQL